jgi:hypothetical protein
MDLEKIALQYPHTRGRVDTLQSKLNSEFLPTEMIKYPNKQGIFLDNKGRPGTMETISPNKNAVYSLDGEPLPVDIVNKSL